MLPLSIEEFPLLTRPSNGTEQFPSLTPTPISPASLGANKNKIRPQPTVMARRKQAKGRRQKTLITDTLQEMHPATVQEASSSETLEGMGESVLLNILHHMNHYSTKTVINMGLTCRSINELVAKRHNIWRDLIRRDYDVTESPPGISPYHHYRFLSAYMGFHGRYVYNKNAHKKVRDYLPEEENLWHAEIELLMDIDVVPTGFSLSFLEPSQYGPFVGREPFLQARLVPNDKCETDLLLLPAHKATGQQKWERKDYLKQKCTLEQWLFNCSSLYSALVEMIEGKHLVQLPRDDEKKLDPLFRSPDGVWPITLLEPGVFKAPTTMMQLVISYSGRLMVMEPMTNIGHDPFDVTTYVDLGSACEIEDCSLLTKKQLLALDVPRDGNPLALDSRKWLKVTDYNQYKQYYRVIYSRAHRTHDTLTMKILVLNPSTFIMFFNEGALSFRRLRFVE